MEPLCHCDLLPDPHPYHLVDPVTDAMNKRLEREQEAREMAEIWLAFREDE